jgi:hypothetical protein
VTASVETQDDALASGAVAKSSSPWRYTVVVSKASISSSVETDLPIALPAQRDVVLGSLLDALLPAGSSPERRAGLTHRATDKDKIGANG